MTRRTLSPLLCLSLLLLLPVFGRAAQADPARINQKEKHARQHIADLEGQWRTATLAGDAALMDKLLSPDFVGISWTGQVNTKMMQLDRVRTHTVIVNRMDLSDVKIKVIGPIAIVTSRAMVESVSDGNDVSGDYRYTRVYQRLTSGVWKITNFEATRIPQPGGPRRGPGQHHGPPDGSAPPGPPPVPPS